MRRADGPDQLSIGGSQQACEYAVVSTTARQRFAAERRATRFRLGIAKS